MWVPREIEGGVGVPVDVSLPKIAGSEEAKTE